MNGHKLRILSSENDASVKVQQDQNTNITLKLEHGPMAQGQSPTPSQADLKEAAPQINTSPPYAPPGFTPGAPMPTPLAPEQFNTGAYPSVSAVPTVSPIPTAGDPSAVNYGYVPQVQTRDIDLTADIEDKDRQIEVLESLATFHRSRPETLISRLTLRTKTDRLKSLSLYSHVMRTTRSSSTNSLSVSTKHS